MSTITRYRGIIAGCILVVIAFFIYSYFFTSAPQAVLSAVPADQSTAAVDQDLITLLGTLKAITLDASLFSDVSFQSLQDFSQQLSPEPVGRANPFAPLGSVSPSH